jgi:hypothetical protein
VANRYTLAGLLSVLAVAGVAALAFVAVGREDAPPPPPPSSPAAQASATASPAPTAAATLPPQRTRDVEEAARLAGCTLQRRPDEGVEHVTRTLSPADYRTNPPTSGPHAPQWAEDRIYGPGETPDLGNLVHTLEHGRINVQYKPGTPESTVRQLEALYEERDHGYHLLLYENPTGMRFAVAATAWDHLLGCPEMNDRVFDALRTFYLSYVDKGPEVVP